MTHLPKIVFRYSRVYNSYFKNNPQILKYLNDNKKSYPEVNEITGFLKTIEKKWEKIGPKILSEISTISNLEWKDIKVNCYIVGYCRPFSDPLTIKIYDNLDDFFIVLIHELIHQIQIQNKLLYKNWIKYLLKNYSNKSKLTRGHIFLYSVFSKIIINNFGKDKLGRYRGKINRPEYREAFEIVDKEGIDNIINKFKKILSLR